MPLRISLAQMEIRHGDGAANLACAELNCAEAASRCSDLLLLPELWCTGLDYNRAAEHARGDTAGVMADLARRHRLHLYGSIFMQRQGGICNTGVLFDSNGKLIAEYSKVHLFRPMGEDRMQAGDAAVVAETQWGLAGLAICYDLRFPELFRRHVDDGAKLVLIVAEWPRARLAHWPTLLRARAIENQVYVIACNAAGESNGVRFAGHSCVIDPWGETVVEGGEDAEHVTAEIDVGRVDEVRRSFPVLGDRRLIEAKKSGAKK
jgi:omega-amidase